MYNKFTFIRLRISRLNEIKYSKSIVNKILSFMTFTWAKIVRLTKIFAHSSILKTTLVVIPFFCNSSNLFWLFFFIWLFSSLVVFVAKNRWNRSNKTKATQTYISVIYSVVFSDYMYHHVHFYIWLISDITN